MGYTHYWRPQRDFTDAEWTHIVTDVEALVDPERLPSDIHLIHRDADDVALEGIYAASGRILFDAEPGCETFLLDKYRVSSFEFCKTRREPYDLVVCAVLLLCQYHAPGALVISSDGDLSDWSEAIDWVKRTLAYKLDTGFL